jgi:hypothetical protein
MGVADKFMLRPYPPSEKEPAEPSEYEAEGPWIHSECGSIKAEI